jgi:hypothetical protein
MIIVIGFCNEFFVKGKLIVSGDPTATASNIMAHESLWRIGATGGLILLACAIATTLILYVLLRPASKNLALLSAFFNLVGIAVEAVARLSLFAVLFLLGGQVYLKAFESHQLHALAYLVIRLDAYGFGVSLLFFSCHLFLNGYLIFKSGYFPRTLGILLMLGSMSYLANSLALFLAPAFAEMIFPILVLAFIGELSLSLWLMGKGVNVEQWKQRAAESAV